MLNIWLEPSSFKVPEFGSSFFNVVFDDEHMESALLSEVDIALIGIDKTLCEKVRENLYRFHNHFRNIRIADMGNFRKIDVEFILPFLEELMTSGVVPVLIGGDYELISALKRLSKSNISFISNSLPDQTDEVEVPVNCLAFQRHLVPYNQLSNIDDLYNQSLSLGKFRTNPNLLEPFLRDTGLVLMDLNSMKASEVPGVLDAYPSGLTTEEICQTMKFAGMAPGLQMVVIKGNIHGDGVNAATVIAESMWYLFEGKNNCIPDHPDVSTPCREFLVTIQDFDTDLMFVRSEISGKWWLKVPYPEENEVMYVACAHEEYQQAVNGHEIPDRLARFILQ